MTASPSVTGTIVVAPSSLAGAAGASQAVAVRVSAAPVRSLAPDAIANPQCFQAFSSASQLVDEALHATAAALDQIAQALQAAAGAYAIADLVAVAPVTG